MKEVKNMTEERTNQLTDAYIDFYRSLSQIRSASDDLMLSIAESASSFYDHACDAWEKMLDSDYEPCIDKTDL